MDVASINSAVGAAGAVTKKDDAAAAKGGFSTILADARKHLGDGEKLTPVKNHAYGRIEGGKHDDHFVNLSGNERSGRVFERVVVDGRVTHVYGGDGGERVVITFAKPAAKPTGGAEAIELGEASRRALVSAAGVRPEGETRGRLATYAPSNPRPRRARARRPRPRRPRQPGSRS